MILLRKNYELLDSIYFSFPFVATMILRLYDGDINNKLNQIFFNCVARLNHKYSENSLLIE